MRSLLVFSVTLLASNDTQLKSCRFVACVTRSRSHAMAFANKDPFVCCIGGCFRKAWVDDDIGDFLCFVCDQKVLNHRAVQSLNAMMSKNPTPTPDGSPTFQDIFAQEGLGVKILENACGDGWDGQCSCRLCKRDWLNFGWVCPVTYYHTEYRVILDARRKAWARGHLAVEDVCRWEHVPHFVNTPRSAADNWEDMVLAIHFELYPPPDDELVDTAGSAQPPPAAHSRRQSRSRSRSRRRHPSSVAQPAHSV